MKTALSTILLLLSIIISAQAPQLSWAKHFIGSGQSQALAITSDSARNVYITGYFQGTVDFDPGPGIYFLTTFTPGDQDIFISKIDENGNFLWARQMVGAGADRGLSVAVDKAGNVFTTGYYGDTTDFDPGAGTFTLGLSGGREMFISKLNSGGIFVFAKQFGTTPSSYIIPNSITTDNSGNIITTGATGGLSDFDPGIGSFTLSTVTSTVTDIFVCKINNQGSFVWARQMGGADLDQGTSVKVDVSGNVYTTGYFISAVADFDPGAASYTLAHGASYADAFISKLDPSGTFIWARQIGGNNSEEGSAIDVDQNGNVYTCGTFNSSNADLDPGAGTYTFAAIGFRDIYISKLDGTGNFLWSKQIGTSSYQPCMTLDKANNIYIAGDFSGSTDFDPGAGSYTLTASLLDIFITKLNAAGNFVWAGQMGGTDSNDALGITTDDQGNVYTTGFFGGTTDFDPGVNTYLLTSPSLINIYVNKLSFCILPSATNNKIICNGEKTVLNANSTGNISWFSSVSSTAAIGNGNSFTTPTLSIGTYTYYAETDLCGSGFSRAAVTVTVNACTGLEGGQHLADGSRQYAVFPNPNNGEFKIISEQVQNNTQIEIYNLLGTLVYHSELKDERSAINLGSQPAGIYVLHILENNGKT